MRVFVAGATGALGTQLVPQLVANGHEVVGTTRTASKQQALRAMGGGRWWPTRLTSTRSPGWWPRPSRG